MNCLAIIFIALALFMFVFGILINYHTQLLPEFLVKVFRYGRANVTTAGSGLLKYLEVPKSWFGHFYFYAVIIQVVVTYTVIGTYVYRDLSGNWLSNLLKILAGNDRHITVSATTTVIAVILLQFHLTRRLYENWFVSIFSGTKMNVFHYGLAFIHYTAAIFAIVANSPGFASGKPNSLDDLDFSYRNLQTIQLPGIFLFFYANYQQYLAHKGYANLRTGKDNSVKTMEHKIPRGGLFEKISCPNYFAEILIYSSFAMILGFRNLTWNCCTLWVFCNQVTSGVMNHRWYKEKFGRSYPQNRKAIIPYIW